MSRLRSDRKIASAASFAFVLLSSTTLYSAALAQRPSPPASTLSIETVLQEADRLRSTNKTGASMELLKSLERRVSDHNSIQYRQILLKRASISFLQGDEQGWRRDLDILLALPAHHNSALSQKACYLLTRPANFQEGRQCLQMVDKSKLTEAGERFVFLAAQFSLARRQNDHAAALEAALEADKLGAGVHSARMVAAALASCGKHKEAREWYQKAAKLSPDPAKVLLVGARVLMAEGDLIGARQLSDAAARAQPGSAPVAFCQADVNAALALKGIKSEPITPILAGIVDQNCSALQRQQKYVRLANDAAGRGDTSSPLRWASKADESLSNATTWRLLAKLNWDLGRYQDSVSWYDKVVQAYANDAVAWQKLALCHARLHQPEKAIEMCSKALSIDPKNVPALKTRAALHLTTDNLMEANADVERLKKLEPEKNHSLEKMRATGAKYSDNLLHYYRRASSTSELDKLRLSDLDKQISQSTDKNRRARLLQDQARLELVIGEYTQAIKHARASIASGNQSYRIHSLAAAALYGLHKQAEAKAEREVAVAMHHEQYLATHPRENSRSTGSAQRERGSQ